MDLSEKTENIISRHPWELSRADMVLRELDKLKVHGDVLDIGCGDGFFDDELLKKFPNLSSVWGIDIYASKSNHSEKKHSVCTYAELEDKKFDFILMMDVIEHIEDDVAFLKEIQKYLKKDSIVFITVPAFQFLFSLHDEELHHYRRYNFKTLNNSLKRAGYKIDGGGVLLIFLFQLNFNASFNIQKKRKFKHVDSRRDKSYNKNCKAMSKYRFFTSPFSFTYSHSSAGTLSHDNYKKGRV